VDAPVVSDRLQRERIWLADVPELFIELRLLSSSDGTALRIAPALLEYNAHVKPGSSDSGPRALGLELTLHAAGTDPTAKTARASTLVLGAIAPGTVRRLLPESETEIADWRPLVEAPWFLAPGSSTVAEGAATPYTLTVALTETRAANATLLALADVFDDARPVLQDEVERQLLASKREEAEIAALEDTNDRSTAYLDAWIAAESKLAALCAFGEGEEPPDRLVLLEAAKEARTAQLAANVTAIAAGIHQPYRPPLPIGEVSLERICS